MEALIDKYGILVAAAAALMGLTIWIVRTVMNNHFKMVERNQELTEARMDKVQEEAAKRVEEERKERAEIREAHQKSVEVFDTTVRNHMTHNTVAVEKLSSAVEDLSGEIRRMNGRRN